MKAVKKETMEVADAAHDIANANNIPIVTIVLGAWCALLTLIVIVMALMLYCLKKRREFKVFMFNCKICLCSLT